MGKWKSRRDLDERPRRYREQASRPASAAAPLLAGSVVVVAILAGIFVAVCFGSHDGRSSAVEGVSVTSTPGTPAPAATSTQEAADVSYTVEDGDTLSEIADRFDVSLNAIEVANPTVEADKLAAGTTIVIPQRRVQTPANSDATRNVSGFIMPIEGACLTANDDQMPNAPRPYRFGIHEGVDFYDEAVCVPIARGTPVLATKDGTVTIATLNYHDLTQAEWDQILARSRASDNTSEPDLYTLRGRQIEVDHGDGIRTRYGHLSRIASGIRPGVRVGAGQVIGYAGNSGTNESITCDDCEMHLHFEVRIGESFLGAGQAPVETRDLYERAFSLR